MSTRRPPRSRLVWAVLLGGPVVGLTYFMVVYLAAEAACANGMADFTTWALGLIIVVATVASAVALLVAAAWAARIRDSSDTSHTADFAGCTGLMLIGLFAFFVLVVAAPAVGSSLC